MRRALLILIVLAGLLLLVASETASANHRPPPSKTNTAAAAPADTPADAPEPTSPVIPAQQAPPAPEGAVVPVGPVGDAPPPEISVSEHGTVSISAQNIEIPALLELLAMHSKRNIVASDAVKGTVSVNLFDVPFDQALDAILDVNGLVRQQTGDFVQVYTMEEWKKVENTKRRRESKVFVVNHLASDDVLEFLKPLVGEGGKIAARGNSAGDFEPKLGSGGGDDYAYATTLVVTDYPENLERIAKVLAELDAAPQQVRIECTVVLAEVDEESALSVDFSFINKLDFTGLTNPLDPVGELADGTVSTNNADAVQTNGGLGALTTKAPTLSVGIIANNISLFIEMLDEVTDTTTLARPNLTLLNRQKGQVLVGERVPYLNATQNDQTVTQTVEFLDVGVRLIVRPFITPEGMIRMDLYPSVSSAKLENLNSLGGTATVPREITRELQTNARVASGQTIVIGGLFTEETTVVSRNVPLLSDIPLLGAAFGGQDDQVIRREILFLITPTIVVDDVAAKEGQEALEMVEVVRVGQRAGLLPFNRERMAEDLQRQAFDSYEKGDTKAALQSIWWARHIKPVTPAMILLEEHIEAGPGTRFRNSLQSLLDSAPGFDAPPGDPEKHEGDEPDTIQPPVPDVAPAPPAAAEPTAEPAASGGGL